MPVNMSLCELSDVLTDMLDPSDFVRIVQNSWQYSQYIIISTLLGRK